VVFAGVLGALAILASIYRYPSKGRLEAGCGSPSYCATGLSLTYLCASLEVRGINQKVSAMSDQPAEDLGTIAALLALAVVLVVLVLVVLGAFLLTAPQADQALLLSG
jgi:hypothetical protein